MSQFKKTDHPKHLMIQCPETLDKESAKDFSSQTKAWMLSPVQNIVLNLESTKSIEREFYQVIIQFKTTLKKDQKKLSSLNLDPKLIKQITKDGVELAFNPSRSLELILEEEKKLEKSSPSINVEMLNPFIAATSKTIEVQAKTKAQPQKPLLKTGPTPNIAIAGILSLLTAQFSGSIVLCFPLPVFLKIYENMFGEKHDKLEAEMEDAAAELLNIIYGSAKTELNQKGHTFQKALPTVLVGEQIRIRQTGIQPAVVIPFETDFGKFFVEIEMNKTLEGSNV